MKTFNKFLLAIASLSLTATTAANAQCKVTSLIINTAEYNYTSLAVGSPDPLWVISNKTAPFLVSAPPIGANAEVVLPDPAWGVTAAGNPGWICDDQNHANPGIPSIPGAQITFQRTFVTCQDADIKFDLDILNDNRVADILVDGVSTGFAQAPLPPYVNNYSTGNDWIVNFGMPLPAGTHTLEIVVDDEYPGGSHPNPVGLDLSGTITAATAVIINNFDANCARATCCDANQGGAGDKIMGLQQEISQLKNQVAQLQSSLGVVDNEKAYASNELFQNTPNPVGKEASIQYNVLTVQKEAFITVTDLTGKVMAKIPVEGKGRGKITIDANKLQPGIYLYTLTVDGHVSATKRMVVSK